jgi:phospholipase A1
MRGLIFPFNVCSMKRFRWDRKTYLTLILTCLLLSVPTHRIQAEEQRTWLDCSRIEDDAARLACYDEIARLTSNKPALAIGMEQPSSKNASYLSKVWELDESEPVDRHVIMAHRSNYFLPFTYNTRPNVGPIKDQTGQAVLESEAVFQISQKVKLWQDVLGKDMDLWAGYTQRSFWQVYNAADSSPFRETNYEPEMLLNFRTDFPVRGMRARTVHLGFNHQSNGRAEPLSRSWNRIVGNIGLEKGNFTLLLKSWYRIPESEEEDDNPDIDDYMGPGEIWGYYLWKEHRFGMMLRNNLQFDDNRGALQLEWSFPLVERVSGYTQFFTGYGESLLDYNHSVNRIGIGFILRDWD